MQRLKYPATDLTCATALYKSQGTTLRYISKVTNITKQGEIHSVSEGKISSAKGCSSGFYAEQHHQPKTNISSVNFFGSFRGHLKEL